MTMWDWVEEYRKRAQADGDKQRLRLTEIHHEAWQFRETNSDRMIGLFLEGRHLAEQLREPWWALFFDYWRLDGMLHWKGDYRGAHEIAIQNVLKSRTAPFAQFPLNFSIQRELASVYLGTDPFGYENEIIDALDYLEREFQPQGGQLYLLLGSRRAFAVTRDCFEEGREISLRELALIDADRSQSNTAHFAVYVYGSLCYIDARRGDWESLQEWTQLGEKTAQKAGHQLTASTFIMWQALLARQARDEPAAQRLRRRAQILVARMNGDRDTWEALAHFHEMGGELIEAVRLRERQCQWVASRGRLHDECSALLERCRLLACLGQLADADIEAVRQATTKMRAPAFYLTRLDAILRGETSRPGEHS